MRLKYFLPVLAFLLVSISSTAQEKKPDWRKLHYLSEEEMSIEVDHYRTFYETDPPVAPVRNVAEFEEMEAVLVRYPFGIPMTLVKELADDIKVLTIVANAGEEATVTAQYSNNGVNLANCSFMYAPSNSYWTRDYGPWFVFDGNKQPGIVNFPYNRPRPNDDDIPLHVANYLDIDVYGMNLIHTGGNYMTDGLGISASTDLVPEENPSLSDEDIDSLVFHYLGINDYFLMADPLDDYIKHIDCWGKFLSPGKVIIGEVPESDYRYEDFEAVADFFANTTSSWGKPYEVFRVFTPGTPPNTPYTNSLIANNKVFVPITGSTWDDEALDAYEVAMPGYEVVGIMYGGWYNTDALHCRAKGIADIGMLYIKHMPILGTVGPQESYEVTADVIAYSGEDIYSDSVFIYYSINGGGYQSAAMELESGDTWSGNISGAGPGDQVSYYIYAADESARHTMHPYIGEPDPHEFNVFGVQADEIGFNPDTLEFLTFEEAIDGLPLEIINLKSNLVEILDITDEAAENSLFAWWVENMPELPMEIEGKDTLTILVKVGIPLNLMGEMLFDTLTVTTALDSYQAIISVDSDLVASIDQRLEEGVLKVFPNPFIDLLNFAFSIEKNQQVQCRIFDLSGKLIYEERSAQDKGSISISWDVPQHLKSGSYLYQISFDDQVVSGKVILNR